MFRKRAKAEVIEVRSSPNKVEGASLSKFASFEDYKTDDGFIYVRVRAISSRVNKNHDGWPAEELKKAYGTFLHKPIFVDHHNSDPTKARGVVVDAALHVEDFDKKSSLDPYYASAPANHLPPTWIELLLEVDAKRFPKLAKAIIAGEIDGVSMGCNVEKSVCSHCGNEAYAPDQYCSHIQSKGAYYDYTNPDGTKTSKKSYEDCYDIGFFEISFVFDPADETALASEIKTSKREVYAELGMPDVPTPEDPPEDPFGGEDFGDYGFEQEDEKSKVYHWRLEQLLQAGIPEQEASVLAARDDIDLHKAVQYAQQGASADQIMQLLKPVWEGENIGIPYSPQVALVAKTAGIGDVLHGVGQKFDDFIDYSAPQRPDFSNCPACKQGLSWDGHTQHVPGCPEHPANNPNGPMTVSKTADRNPPPQAEMTSAPDKVDTLRQEQVCPICGSDMEDGVCEVCNYEEPPEGFDNPDLEKAKQVDQQMREQDEDQAAAGMGNQAPNNLELNPDAGDQVSGPGTPSMTTSKVEASTTVSGEQKVSAAPKGTPINVQERPILPVARRTTDRPLNVKTLQDSKKPVQSNTTKDIMPNQLEKIADGATADGGADVQPDGRVDVEGVGAVAGDPLSGIEHENVEKDTGDFVAPHTDTWSDGEGDSLGQQDPVTTEVFEGGPPSGNAVGVSSPPPHNSAFQVVADGSGDLGGPMGENLDQGTGAEQGVRPDSPSDGGFPDHDPSRVDLLADLKEEVGDRTQTFGTDDFHVGEPVTKGQNANELGGPIGTAMASAKAQVFKAFKLAETEVELGLIDADAKFDRVAELENTPETVLDAQLDTLSKVKTAGLKKTTTVGKTASGVGRLPSLQNRLSSAAPIYEEHAVSDEEIDNVVGW